MPNASEPDRAPGKRQWNHEPVPTVQRDLARERVGNRNDARAGQLSKTDRADLDPITGPARAVGRDADVTTILHRARQFAQRLPAATAGGAADANQVESGQYARQFLAVLAGADEHGGPALARVPVFLEHVGQ